MTAATWTAHLLVPDGMLIDGTPRYRRQPLPGRFDDAVTALGATLRAVHATPGAAVRAVVERCDADTQPAERTARAIAHRRRQAAARPCPAGVEGVAQLTGGAA